jgi:tRNA threonylcarbamoyladenosine biosynthesis protein TsaB
MIDARKDEVYAALYEPLDSTAREDSPESVLGVRQVNAAVALPPSDFLRTIDTRATMFVGSGAVRYQAPVRERFGDRALFAADDNHAPSLRVLCRFASELEPLGAEETVALEPLYIRSSGARLNPLRKISMND